MTPEGTTRPDSRNDRPAEEGLGNSRYGSDAMVQTFRELDIPYIALNPGSSYRGIHDSLVNYLGNRAPQMLLCVHEEIAVTLAHGYAKVTGKPMIVGIHANVGTLHGAMGMFCAWCDRMPMIVFAGNGPMDAFKRRPWIDWIHTVQDLPALVRGFTKWDAQPSSVRAAQLAILQGYQRAVTPPKGPVYLSFDLGLQEELLDEMPPALDVARLTSPAPPAQPDPVLVAEAARILGKAERPVVLMGRVSRDPGDWTTRRTLAQHLGARVVNDFRAGAGFPTDHALYVGTSGLATPEHVLKTIREADAILSLDWADLGGTLRLACGWDGRPGTIVHASLDEHNHRGLGQDHYPPVPADLRFMNEPDIVADALADALGVDRTADYEKLPEPDWPAAADGDALAFPAIVSSIRHGLGDRPISLLRGAVKGGPQNSYWHFRDPLAQLGQDGGGGIGSGPGMAVGAALALRDLGTGHFPIAVTGDGDFMMSVSALWTAVHYGIPLMIVIYNNNAFYNDVRHQEQVAGARGRSAANKWVGQSMIDPDIDFASIARAQGASGFGPIRTVGAFRQAFAEGARIVDEGGVAVIDARVEDP